MEIDEAVLGFYEPGFIHLRINTDQSLENLEKLKEDPSTIKYYSTFLHEYLHFLQDITTTQGLSNFIYYIEYLRNANKIILENGQSNFETPVKIDNKYNLIANSHLRGIYVGENRKTPNAYYKKYSYKYQNITKNNGKVIQVKKYTVKYFNQDNKKFEDFHLGSKHIKEYMAHYIQNQLVPGTKHNCIPYTIIEQIALKEYPHFSKDKSLILALCDASLMSYHPVQLFFDTIEKLKKKKKYKLTTAKSLYSFIYREFTFEEDGQIETIESLFEKTNIIAKGNFQDSLKADVFKNNVVWFEEIINVAKDLRINNPDFFLKLIEAPGKLSPLFIEIIKTLGTPFMTNLSNNGFFIPPEKLKSAEIYPYYPKVFHAIYNTHHAKKECILKGFCSTNIEKTTNDLCNTSPWERINEPKACPYAQIWHTWGLDSFTPIITTH